MLLHIVRKVFRSYGNKGWRKWHCQLSIILIIAVLAVISLSNFVKCLTISKLCLFPSFLGTITGKPHCMSKLHRFQHLRGKLHCYFFGLRQGSPSDKKSGGCNFL